MNEVNSVIGENIGFAENNSIGEKDDGYKSEYHENEVDFGIVKAEAFNGVTNDGVNSIDGENFFVEEEKILIDEECDDYKSEYENEVDLNIVKGEIESFNEIPDELGVEDQDYISKCEAVLADSSMKCDESDLTSSTACTEPMELKNGKILGSFVNYLSESQLTDESNFDEKIDEMYFIEDILESTESSQDCNKGQPKSKKEFCCKECTYKCGTKKQVVQHINAYHFNSKRYHCKECDFKSNWPSSLRIHVKSVHLNLRSYVCDYCNFKATQKSNMKMHMDNVHFKVKRLQCFICGYKTNHRGHLKRHVDSVHSDVNGLTYPETNLEIAELAGTKNKELKCPECNYVACLESDLELHIGYIHPELGKSQISKSENPDDCLEHMTINNQETDLPDILKNQDAIYDDEVEKHISKVDYNMDHSEPIFKEDEDIDDIIDQMYTIEKILQSKQSIKGHQPKYLKEFSCKECEYKCGAKKQVVQHINAIHLNSKRYQCKDCDFKTNYPSSLRMHIRSVHLNLKSYVCDYCSFKATQKTNVKMHMDNVHFKLKGLKCFICEYKTNHRGHLKRHVDTVHSDLKSFNSSETPFEMNWIDGIELDLTKGDDELKEFKCLECDYMAFMELDLKKHIEHEHSELKQFSPSKSNESDNVMERMEVIMQESNEPETFEDNNPKTPKEANCNMDYDSEHPFVDVIDPELEKLDKMFTVELLDSDTLDFSLPESDWNISINHLRRRYGLNSKKQYCCTLCEYISGTRKQMRQHIDAHHLDSKKYHCGDCDFKTNWSNSLRLHVNSAHLKAKSFQCSKCSFKTFQRVNLKLHDDSVHLKLKPFGCDYCKYKCNQKSHLKRHIDCIHSKDLKAKDIKRKMPEENFDEESKSIFFEKKQKNVSQTYKCPVKL